MGAARRIVWLVVVVATVLVSDQGGVAVATGRTFAVGSHTYTLCASRAVSASEGAQIDSLLTRRLSGFPGIHGAHVSRHGARCFHAALRSPRGATSILAAAGAVGAVYTADSGRSPLNPGRRVRLVCPHTGCAPGVPTGRENLSASPPLLAVVLGPGVVRGGSVQVFMDSGHQPGVVYRLTSRASGTWCSFTTRHVNGSVADVANGKVVQDATIEEPICGGTDQIPGIVSSTQAYALAGYLAFGPLPLALTVHTGQ